MKELAHVSLGFWVAECRVVKKVHYDVDLTGSYHAMHILTYDMSTTRHAMIIEQKN